MVDKEIVWISSDEEVEEVGLSSDDEVGIPLVPEENISSSGPSTCHHSDTDEAELVHHSDTAEPELGHYSDTAEAELSHYSDTAEPELGHHSDTAEAELGHYSDTVEPELGHHSDMAEAELGHNSDTAEVELGFMPVKDTGLYGSQAPLCRKFWKAGNYDNGLHSKSVTERDAANSFLHVHPLFLHSNATSHKWVFGAIAELLDNAFDEGTGDKCKQAPQGATFVMVDRISNPKDGSPALLIQDNGSGMDPEAMRRFMSFGFSDKKSNLAIGQYGNGFKTGSMRLGADAIVFSCHQNDTVYTTSIGLLSYTFLTLTQLDRIIVPMVNYKFDTSTGHLELQNGEEHFTSNLSLMLKWSPFQSEEELIKQFTDIGYHGTKIIIFNLWFNDDGNLELDFDTDPEDIRIAGDIRKIETTPGKMLNEKHIANRFQYSLRDYLSILYLRMPESFRIILRGQVVKLHNIADDLKYTNIIKYTPHTSAGLEKAKFVVTIGFLKEAPKVNKHGFNIYHKNRLILPFWPVVSYLKNRGGGVVGILEADFIEPTHNKQDFERTSLFQKLEIRLKDMTLEYWDLHCHLIGYQKKDHRNPVEQSNLASLTKRKRDGLTDHHKMKAQGKEKNLRGRGCNQETMTSSADQFVNKQVLNLLEAKKSLHARLSAYEKTDEELNLEVMELRSKIEEAKVEYSRLLAEARSLDLGV